MSGNPLNQSQCEIVGVCITHDGTIVPNVTDASECSQYVCILKKMLLHSPDKELGILLFKIESFNRDFLPS